MQYKALFQSVVQIIYRIGQMYIFESRRAIANQRPPTGGDFFAIMKSHRNFWKKCDLDGLNQHVLLSSIFYEYAKQEIYEGIRFQLGIFKSIEDDAAKKSRGA